MIEEPVATPRQATAEQPPAFPGFWELARALNRSDPAALAVAEDGADSRLTIDETDLKKLLGTPWFRTVFPCFSQTWRQRLFDVLVESTIVPNHALRVGRQEIHLSEITYPQLKEIFSQVSVTDAIRGDLRLLMAVGSLWGPESLGRLQFGNSKHYGESSKLAGLLQGFRAE